MFLQRGLQQCSKSSAARNSAGTKSLLFPASHFSSTSSTSSSPIVLLPGDGVGPEIVDEGARILQCVSDNNKDNVTFDLSSYDVGGAAIEATSGKTSLPETTLDACLNSSAVLLGAVGLPKYDAQPVRPEQGLLALRKSMDLFANLRPVKFFPELLHHSPLRPDIVSNVDFLVVRELVSGIYFGKREEASPENNHTAWDTMLYEKGEVERIARLALSFAEQRASSRNANGLASELCSVDKANVLASSRLWRSTVQDVWDDHAKNNKNHENTTLRHQLVDSCAMQIITNPSNFDVVVTSNMFGDILTDEASVLAGSLGLLPSASLSEEGKPGVYEPIHGSAPDIAGKSIVNPIATILSVAMMLRHTEFNNGIRLTSEADAIEQAVSNVLAKGLRTRDIISKGNDESHNETIVSTIEMGKAIEKELENILRNASSSSASRSSSSSSSSSSQSHSRSFSTLRRSFSTLRSNDDGNNTPLTMFDKIWRDHVVVEGETASDPSLLYIDRHLVHEVTSPQAFEGLELSGRHVRRLDCTLATVDHNVPTKFGKGSKKIIENKDSLVQVTTLEENVQKFGLSNRYFGMEDSRQGIVHIIGPEQGFTQPGMTIVCGDSHTATHGAFGALAFGIGTSEVEHVLATQTLRQGPAKSMLIRVDGDLLPGVTSKDLVLHIIGEIGTAGGTGHVIEFAGQAVEELSMESRMTVCNMAIEAGARAGMIAPDDTTFAYLKGRPMAPADEHWDDAIQHWKSLRTDDGAIFDKEIILQGKDIAPQVTWGTSPEDVVGVDGRVPTMEDYSISKQDSVVDPLRQSAFERKMEYMGLQGGEKITDIDVDVVFVGSCTNGRIEDLRAVADVIKTSGEGAEIASNIKQAIIVPGSGLVKKQAMKEGLDVIFEKAGFEFREPGCSMCLAMNDDKLLNGQRCASTSNRNFEGRQGRGGRTHLVSPAMAAAAALRGKFSDVRHIGKRQYSTTASTITNRPRGTRHFHSSGANLSGSITTTKNPFQYTGCQNTEVCVMGIDNIDTDMIIPKQFLKTVKRTGLGKHVFHEMRFSDEEGQVAKDDFVLNEERFSNDDSEKDVVLVTGANFGCGSSREHAPWALKDFGIRTVIASSFADIFHNNCYKNGMLPLQLPTEECEKVRNVISQEGSANTSIEIDLEKQNLRVVRKGDNSNLYEFDFQIDPARKKCLLAGLDEIGVTLDEFENDIKRYEERRQQKYPWL